MGVVILRKAFLKSQKERHIGKGIYPLGLAGGFLDATGGGGWGPVVTSTMLAVGHDVKKDDRHGEYRRISRNARGDDHVRRSHPRFYVLLADDPRSHHRRGVRSSPRGVDLQEDPRPPAARRRRHPHHRAQSLQSPSLSGCILKRRYHHDTDLRAAALASVRARLMELELWDADSLVMTAPGAVCSAAGEPVEAALFSAVSAPMAVLPPGGTPANLPKDPHALCAETDDAAQMFGVRVPVRSAPRRGDAACIVPNRGFVVTARFENELIAACILLEKLCMTALLSRRIGTPKPLAAPLCLIEHAVYTKNTPVRRSPRRRGEEAAPVAQDVSDLALRESVVAYGKKLVENRLIQATWGTFRRVSMPIAFSSRRPAWTMTASVRRILWRSALPTAASAAGQRPSSEREMHRRIYAARGDVRAVIHTHSAALQTFAACRESLRTPEIVAPAPPTA